MCVRESFLHPNTFGYTKMHTITLYLLCYCVERKNEMFFSDIIEFVNKKKFFLKRKIEIYEMNVHNKKYKGTSRKFSTHQNYHSFQTVRVISQVDFVDPKRNLGRLVFLNDRVIHLIHHVHLLRLKQLYRYCLNPHRYSVLEVIANPDAVVVFIFVRVDINIEKEIKRNLYSIKIGLKCVVMSYQHGK